MNVFFMLKTTFPRHQLIKISMICAYIKPEVKKNYTAAITIAKNEAFIG